MHLTNTEEELSQAETRARPDVDEGRSGSAHGLEVRMCCMFVVICDNSLPVFSVFLQKTQRASRRHEHARGPGHSIFLQQQHSPSSSDSLLRLP